MLDTQQEIVIGGCRMGMTENPSFPGVDHRTCALLKVPLDFAEGHKYGVHEIRLYSSESCSIAGAAVIDRAPVGKKLFVQQPHFPIPPTHVLFLYL